jgi:hypothetical protein
VLEFGSSASIGIEGAGSDSDSGMAKMTEKIVVKRSIDVCQIERGLRGLAVRDLGEVGRSL